VRQFQLGAFKAAVEAVAPIIPVSLSGTRFILPDGAWLPRPSNVTIILSPPIFPHVGGGEATDWHELIRLRDSTREAIAKSSGEVLL
jgi:1-acyl-sn-glycerol-3-phosphate acyltransferase